MSGCLQISMPEEVRARQAIWCGDDGIANERVKDTNLEDRSLGTAGPGMVWSFRFLVSLKDGSMPLKPSAQGLVPKNRKNKSSEFRARKSAIRHRSRGSRNQGMTAVARFEYPLSTLFESTAVAA
jgi:hypothetical protein